MVKLLLYQALDCQSAHQHHEDDDCRHQPELADILRNYLQLLFEGTGLALLAGQAHEFASAAEHAHCEHEHLAFAL